MLPMLTRSGLPSISPRFPRTRFRATAELGLVRPMKRVPTVIALCVAAAVCAHAQYSLIKSADGVLVVSKVPGRKFSVDVPGSEIVPYGLKQADHPYLTADGHLLQIMSVPLAEFHADPKSSDNIVLKQQMEYEANYVRLALSAVKAQQRKLASGKSALVWSFSPGTQIKRQVNLTFRSGSYVVALVSAVDDTHSAADIETFLTRIANSFHAK
jgi:hypothetical protein